MKKVSLYRKELLHRYIAVAVAVMIIISSVSMIKVMISSSQQENPKLDLDESLYPSCPFEVNTILTEDGIWKEFNHNYPAGTPAKAYVAALF